MIDEPSFDNRYGDLGSPGARHTKQAVALLSCVKSKRSNAAPAADLYVSALFQGMRKYAQTRASSWFVLSAEHGLLDPDRVIEPYERTLKTMSTAARLEWASRVQAQL